MPSHHLTKSLPSVEYLRARLDYNQKTGELRWRPRPQLAQWNSKNAGKIAGTAMTNGYCQIYVDDRPWYAHRLIWKWMTGDEPPKTIDHKDGDRSNNRWRNLRAATQSEQNYNSRTPSHNTSGYKGVCRFRGKWLMQLQINKSRIVRTFSTREEASAAYESAARKLHGRFYRPT
jgi:hypothetical protein